MARGVPLKWSELPQLIKCAESTGQRCPRAEMVFGRDDPEPYDCSSLITEKDHLNS